MDDGVRVGTGIGGYCVWQATGDRAGRTFDGALLAAAGRN